MASASDLLVTMASSWPRSRSVRHGVDDAVVAADEPVVVGELIFAIRGDERGDVGVVARVAARTS